MKVQTGKKITGFYKGEPLSISLDATAVENNLSILSSTLYVKSNYTDENSNAIIYNYIDSTDSIFGKVINDGSVTGSGNLQFKLSEASTKASLSLDPSGNNNTILYEAVNSGQLGNNISIAYVNPGTPNASLSLTVSGNSITVNLETDNSSAILTSADDIVSAILANSAASALVTPSTVGSGTGIVQARTATYLTGGNGSTSDLTPGFKYFYVVRVTLSDNKDYLLENGFLISLDPESPKASQAVTTSARASNSGSARIDRIINEYLDVILSDFRQLKVWDEHARRSAHDPKSLFLTYQNLNDTIPEVFDSQNNPVDVNDIVVDKKVGKLSIIGDSGHNDYFVTYTFDMFPAEVLEALTKLKLQELNVLGAAEGGYLTNYSTVDSAPEYWDGPLTLGVAAEAYKRLQMDSGLWKNYLIWQNGDAGQNLAGQAADWYLGMYTEMAKGLKKQHLIAQPTSAFQLFRSVGFGFFAVGGDKFRGLQVNKLLTY